MNRKAIGDNAERLACQYLQRHGLKLLGRNFRCRGGEIDLIMQHGDSLVFVEVRYRRRTGFGRAAETVSALKQDRVIRCAQVYINQHRCWNKAARFDVLSVEGETDQLRIDWITNAFQTKAL
jgi:putative endonuclease